MSFDLKNLSSSQSIFSYTGAQQTWVVPIGVTAVTIKAFGAQGNDCNVGTGAVGGSATAEYVVTPGETLYIFVGGSGFNGNGYNGGAMECGGCLQGGGGASDVRRGGTSLFNRIIVAGGGGYYGGGGGGCGNCETAGGNGSGGGSSYTGVGAAANITNGGGPIGNGQVTLIW